MTEAHRTETDECKAATPEVLAAEETTFEDLHACPKDDWQAEQLLVKYAR